MIWGVYITNDDLCLFAAVLSAQQPSNYIAKKGNKDMGTLMIAGVTWRFHSPQIGETKPIDCFNISIYVYIININQPSFLKKHWGA